MNEQPRITDELLDQIADREAEVARISVLRRLVGLPVRGRAGHRIDRALEAHGLRAPFAMPPARRVG